MTLKLGMLLLGSILIYGGWTNRDIRSLIFGDNQTQKSGSSWPASSPGGAASQGGTGAAGPGLSPQGQPAAPNAGQVQRNTTGFTTVTGGSVSGQA